MSIKFTTQMSKKPRFWIAIVFVILAFTSAALYIMNRDKTVYSNEMIGTVSKEFKKDIKAFLSTAEKSVNQMKIDALTIDVDNISADSLDFYFSQFIQNEKYLQGVVIFGNDMNYVIYREDQSWVTTHNMQADSSVKWSRLDNNLKETGNWYNTYNFFMEQKQLDILKVADIEPGEHVWRTARGSEKLTDRDLFFNIFLLNGDGDTDDLVALMYRTNELGNRFSRVLKYQNPLVTVLTNRNDLVTPIRTDDTNQISRFKSLLPKVENAFHEWQKTNPEDVFTMSFVAFNTDFWIGFDTISPILGARGYAITLSENDLTENKKKLDEAYLYAAILFLLFALALLLPLFRKRRMPVISKDVELSPLSNDDIIALIKKGESEKGEFKSSLRWDYREEKVNKILEDVILKSIAAFANAKGGILMIGVNDDLEIIGLEPDFRSLKKQDVDYFELHLRKLVNNQYGIRFSNKHLLMQFPDFEKKIICIINITPGDKPLYLKTRNKQGHEVEKFYVRSGNASQEIISLKEINEYVAGHFKVKN